MVPLQKWRLLAVAAAVLALVVVSWPGDLLAHGAGALDGEDIAIELTETNADLGPMADGGSDTISSCHCGPMCMVQSPDVRVTIPVGLLTVSQRGRLPPSGHATDAPHGPPRLLI